MVADKEENNTNNNNNLSNNTSSSTSSYSIPSKGGIFDPTLLIINYSVFNWKEDDFKFDFEVDFEHNEEGMEDMDSEWFFIVF